VEKDAKKREQKRASRHKTEMPCEIMAFLLRKRSKKDKRKIRIIRNWVTKIG
jgi:hypothetical protein